MRSPASIDIVRRLSLGSHHLSALSRERDEIVQLDAVSLISIVSEAASNVNYMLLEQFVTDLGFHRRPELAQAIRALTPYGPLVVLTLVYEDGDDAVRLVYGEFGRVRLAAAFITEDVAFIRDSRVVMCPLQALDERLIARTSLHVPPIERGRGTDRRALPPVA